MKPFHTMRFAGLGVAAAAVWVGMFCGPAQAALFQCTGATGETLFTDAGCPPGYRTDLIVPEAPAPAKPSAERQAVDAPGRIEANKPPAAEAETARAEAELENARLRSELQQERLRAIDRKLDALLEVQPVYGGVGLVPFGVVPKPFSACKGKPGQTPWVNCRPGRADRKAKISVEQRPSCGIVGCTPSIIRRPERDNAGRTMR